MALWTRDAQNANAIGAAFGLGKVNAGQASFGNDAVTTAITHGLGAAPNFVVLAGNVNGSLTWSANTTTLTVTRATSTSSGTVSYLIGVRA